MVLGNPLPAQARHFQISKVYLEYLSNSIVNPQDYRNRSQTTQRRCRLAPLSYSPEYG